MPKHTHLLQANKKTEKKKRSEGPETANDFLAAGVDFEEAGEKWRAGDAAKSLRFFLRAAETYDAGLQKYPRSFDLAYNKARLQYEVAQQPRLLAQLPTPLLELLQTALDSHRFALTIDQDIPDLLFNTAQVLTSLAETLSEGKASVNEHREEALRLFQEALEFFQRCLSLQELKYTQGQEIAAQDAASLSDADNAGTATTSGNISNAAEEEVWASLEEPVTIDTLLDTAIAQLDTLTALCSLGSSHARNDLAWIEEYYHTELQNKIDHYISDNRQHEAALARANFICTIAEAAFRGGKFDLPTYERELGGAFSHQDLDLDKDPQGLCDKADAYLTFNTSVQNAILQAQLHELAQVGTICWKHITKALDSLTTASKLPDPQNLPRIHLRMGDCELLRLQLGEAPLNYNLAVKSAPTLIKNAEVYFRGAAAIIEGNEDFEGEKKEAEVKEAIAMALAGNSQRLGSLIKLQRNCVEATMEEMRDEGLLSEDRVQNIGRLFT